MKELEQLISLVRDSDEAKNIIIKFAELKLKDQLAGFYLNLTGNILALFLLSIACVFGCVFLYKFIKYKDFWKL